MKKNILITLSFLLYSGSILHSENTFASMPPTRYADAHMHNSNYAGQGVTLRKFIHDYGQGKVVRSVLMPIPLQQKWDAYEHFANDKMPPNYYLGSEGELYYSALMDALVAKEYQHLPKRAQAQLDPMITGFNPMDMYATEHVQRVLIGFPGVFSGIGEFTIHKEIVSDKIVGQPVKKLTDNLPADLHKAGTMTLYNPSLIKLLKFTAESGLVSVMHNDIYEVMVSPEGQVFFRNEHAPYTQALMSLCKASPGAKVIWAHTGLGRYAQPAPDHLIWVSKVLDNCPDWSVDISWDIVQKWILQGNSNMPTLKEWSQFITKYQDRVLWGTDTVLWSANTIQDNGQAQLGKRLTPQQYQATVSIIDPLWEALGPEVSEKVRIKNYQRLFNTARKQVRQWEKEHKNDDVWAL